MFNDKYGLTQAVLEGRKTQTRRIVTNRCLSGLTEKDVKVHTFEFGMVSCEAWNVFSESSKYKIGEEIAVAQPYKDVCGYYEKDYHIGKDLDEELKDHKGYYNKMFVAAGLMPHRICITDIRVERLQDISDSDCMAEGIQQYPDVHNYMWGFSYFRRGALRFELSTTPREAYANLIDKICGKGTWEKNPFVFVYDFKLVR